MVSVLVPVGQEVPKTSRVPATRDGPLGLALLESLARWILKGAVLVAPCNQLGQIVSQGSASSQAR